MTDDNSDNKPLRYGEVKVHPLAEKFPLLEGREFDELVDSIRRNGLLHPVVVLPATEHRDRLLIDGRNRLRACEAAGVEPTVTDDLREMTAEGFILVENVHRRHLTPDQKRDVIAASLKADPALSNRQHAERTASSHPTVAKVRDELERAGQLESLTSRTGKDGRERRMLDAHPEISRPERRKTPLPDKWGRRVVEIQRALLALESLAEDERFPKYRERLGNDPAWSSAVPDSMDRVQSRLDDTLYIPISEHEELLNFINDFRLHLRFDIIARAKQTTPRGRGYLVETLRQMLEELDEMDADAPDEIESHQFAHLARFAPDAVRQLVADGENDDPMKVRGEYTDALFDLDMVLEDFPPTPRQGRVYADLVDDFEGAWNLVMIGDGMLRLDIDHTVTPERARALLQLGVGERGSANIQEALIVATRFVRALEERAAQDDEA